MPDIKSFIASQIPDIESFITSHSLSISPPIILTMKSTIQSTILFKKLYSARFKNSMITISNKFAMMITNQRVFLLINHRLNKTVKRNDMNTM